MKKLLAVGFFLGSFSVWGNADQESDGIITTYENIEARELSTIFDANGQPTGRAVSPYGVMRVTKVNDACEADPRDGSRCKRYIRVDKDALYKAYLDDRRPMSSAVKENLNNGFVQGGGMAFAVLGTLATLIIGSSIWANAGWLAGLATMLAPLLIYGIGVGASALAGVVEGANLKSRAKELLRHQPDTYDYP
ncbi:MAG: hypothetical protein AABZ44_09835 [Elusimicrobiota bacterium]